MDSTQFLTCGNPVGIPSLLDNLVFSRDQITAVVPAANDKPGRIGRLHFVNGERSAHLSFILPSDDIDSKETMQLLDGLAAKAGECGCLSLQADLDEDSVAFQTFRRCGYSVYTHQQIYCSQGTVLSTTGDETTWEPISPRSGVSIRSLYQALVPPLVQGMEPLPAGALPGWVGIQDGEVAAYAVHKSGPAGDFVQPIIHPAVRDAGALLTSLLAKIKNISSRPLYLAVRSYQAWLEKYLTEENWLVLPRQVLMAKHLTAFQRIPVTSERRSVMEASPTTEPTAPMAGFQSHTKL